VKPFSLADAVGVSSAAPAKFLSAGVGMAQLNPIFAYWPIDPGVQAEPFQMGDGGNNENFGLLAMLQSGVNKSAVFVNTNKALNPNASATGSLCDWQEKEGELWGLLPPDGLAEAADMSVTCLFGECHDAIGAHYSNNQVFPNDKLQPLLCDLERLVQAGRPAVVKQTLDVLKNDWWGIVGGNQVEIVWFYNEKCTDFEAQLPEDTKAALAQGEDGPFANFPFYKTMLQNPPELTSLTVEQINLLSAQTQYAVQQSADLMCSVMGC
jgi:hypothetical protein